MPNSRCSFAESRGTFPGEWVPDGAARADRRRLRCSSWQSGPQAVDPETREVETEGAVSDPRRILVVDDDDDIRQLARTVLEGAGFAVTTASGGNEALDRLVECPFDLMLLDINMPDMDGWETLRLMRSDQRPSAPPVVMFSIKGEVRDKIQGLQEGAVDYITKPFVIDTFLSRIRRILDAQATGPATPPKT